MKVKKNFFCVHAFSLYNIPDGPDVTAPVDESVVDPDQPLVVEWVTTDDPNPPESVIEAYQIIVLDYPRGPGRLESFQRSTF